MFQKILVPTDGSTLSDKAIDAAIDVAKRIHGSIVGLSVAQPYYYASFTDGALAGDAAEHEKRSLAVARDNLDKIQAAADAANVPCETMVTKSFEPYLEIIKVAQKLECDSIFMASHGRKGISRAMLGSETQKVLSHTHIPVLVCS